MPPLHYFLYTSTPVCVRPCIYDGICRSWDGRVKAWRRALHNWEDREADNTATKTLVKKPKMDKKSTAGLDEGAAGVSIPSGAGSSGVGIGCHPSAGENADNNGDAKSQTIVGELDAQEYKEETFDDDDVL